MFNAYHYGFLQSPYMCHKLIMEMDFHIVGTGQIICGGLGSHRNKGVAEGHVISKCERLQVRKY